jgi:hypothetical protein
MGVEVDLQEQIAKLFLEGPFIKRLGLKSFTSFSGLLE